MTRFVVYPAVLDDTDNPKGYYTVTFPDLPGAISEGDGVAEAMSKGSEALGLYLYDARKFPKATDIDKVKKENDGKIVVPISADLIKAKKNVKTPTVKKNTTIPRDLAEKAEEKGINFSRTLTEALKQKLVKLS